VATGPDVGGGGKKAGAASCSLQVRSITKPVVRDPERPKKPTTAWLRFLQDFRSKNSSEKGVTVMKTASGRWKLMKPEEKRPWEDAYQKEKAQFDKVYKEYVDSGKKDAWERPPNKPRKPGSAYFIYAGEYRAENPHLKPVEATKIAAALWKDMTPEKRRPYELKYEKDKEQYNKDLKAYEASGQEEAWKAKVGISKVEGKQRAALEKKRADAEKKKEAEAAKKKLAAEKKKAAAEKKKAVAAEKKKLAAEKKKLAVEKKKAAAAKKKEAAEKKTTTAAAEKKAVAGKIAPDTKPA